MMIRYKAGYKYVLAEDYHTQIAIYPRVLIETDYVTLTRDGRLTIRAGYCWDGPSGPSIDTRTFLRGSLVHDVLYQLMRHQFLLPEEWRKTADQILQRICINDGMWLIRAWWVYFGVRFGGGPGSSRRGKKPILIAP